MSDMVPKWTLGDRLTKARHCAEVSQQEMADYLGLSRPALSYYETGVSMPKLGTLRLWALRTGVSLDWLRYGDEGTEGNVKSSCSWIRPDRRRRSDRRKGLSPLRVVA